MINVFEWRSVALLLPEITLFFTAIFALLIDLRRSRKGANLIILITTLGMSVALLHSILAIRYGPSEVLSGSLLIDSVSQFFKVLLIFAGMLVVLLSWTSDELENEYQAETQTLILLCTLTFCIMSSAMHLLFLFLAYEIANLICCVLVAVKRKSEASTEAAIKAFVYWTLSAIFFALGIVIFYMIGKSFNILEIQKQLTSHSPVPIHLWLAFGLVFMAMASRMAVFPFHFISIDIRHGASIPVSAFFSVAPVVAALSVTVRICIQVFSSKVEGGWSPLANMLWPEFIAGIAAATMTIGNLTAFYQRNLKQLLACASVAQIGFVLMGLAVANKEGVASVLFSIVAYSAMIFGVFFIVQWVSKYKKNEDIQILNGLIWKRPYEGVLLCIFILGLAGLPPFIGFISRFYLLGVVVQEKLYWLALVAGLNWVISLAYYLSIVRQIVAHQKTGYRQLDQTAYPSPGFAVHFVLGFLSVPTVVLGLYWDPLMHYVHHSLTLVHW